MVRDLCMRRRNTKNSEHKIHATKRRNTVLFIQYFSRLQWRRFDTFSKDINGKLSYGTGDPGFALVCVDK